MNEEIITNLNERLDKTIDKGRELLEEDQLQQRLDEVKDQAEILIKKHPVKSVLIGAAVGFVLGKLLSSGD